VEKADDVQAFENETAPFLEYRLAVMQLADELNGPDLSAGDAGVAGVLGEPEPALNAAGNRATDVASNSVYLGVIESIDVNAVIWTEPAEMCADFPGCSTSRAQP